MSFLTNFCKVESVSVLADFSTKPHYALAVLCLVADPNVADEIRQAASVNFKNHLKSRWAPSDDPNIGDDEKDQIKALIVHSLMLNASPRIQGQLSEALVLIGKHDFPTLWPSLLRDLIQSLQKASQAGDYASVNGILGIANSIFNKFRHEYKTNDLLDEISRNLASNLWEIFKENARSIESAGGDAAALKPLFVSQRLCCSIFFSLNYQELHEFFKDHMDEWIKKQHKYLSNSYPALESTAEGVALVDELRAAVCENFSLHLEKNEKEFLPYSRDSANAVWNLLSTLPQASSRDQLAVTAIKFITVSTGLKHMKLTDAAGWIQKIFLDIVIPNVRLRDEDVELFKINHIEFIRRDMEGSGIDTRRRMACELLKGIVTNYKPQVTDLVSVQIQNLLTSFAANPAENWKDKDSAIYLVVSLATKRAGGTSFPIDDHYVENFFLQYIVPELKSQNINESPILKAAALNFFTMFRNQLLKTTASKYFPYLIRFLCAQSNVVHSYAASCIEKLLLVKDEGGQARYTSVDISPLLPQLMNNLFEALKVPKSEENQYLMKCIMRVSVVADISFVIHLPWLTPILYKACENPINPLFNHYAFECVAVLVKRASAKDAPFVEKFEIELSSIIQKILVENVQEFYPYAFQLMAQVVKLSRPPIRRIYWENLVVQKMWTKASNASALVVLFEAFLQKDKLEIETLKMVQIVLWISYDLVAYQRTEEQGFYVLNTIIKCLDFNVIATYISDIWTALLIVLPSRQTGKFIKGLLILMSLFLVKHGCTNLVNSVNVITQEKVLWIGSQANLFLMLLGQFWIHHLTNITGVIETKLTAVASTRLLCESQMLLVDAHVEQWGLLLNSIVTLLSRTEQERVEEDPVSSTEQERVEEDPEILMPEFSENFVYSATFVRLHHAGKTEDDPLKDIRDAKELLVTSLARLSALSPAGTYPQIISQYVEPTNQAELLRLCNSYNCQII